MKWAPLDLEPAEKNHNGGGSRVGPWPQTYGLKKVMKNQVFKAPNWKGEFFIFQTLDFWGAMNVSSQKNVIIF